MKPLEIVETLLKNAEGKLCSRYVLGLERARDSIIAGSPDQALKEQREWFDAIERAKLERKKVQLK